MPQYNKFMPRKRILTLTQGRRGVDVNPQGPISAKTGSVVGNPGDRLAGSAKTGEELMVEARASDELHSISQSCRIALRRRRSVLLLYDKDGQIAFQEILAETCLGMANLPGIDLPIFSGASGQRL
jgi:hypothetical protein